MTLPLKLDLPSVVTCTPVSKMFKCQKKCASLNQWNEECYLPTFCKHFNQWPFGSGPIWDLRHKGPFPPWLLPAHSTETDAKVPLSSGLGTLVGPLSQPSEQLSASNQLTALFCHCSGPLKAPSLPYCYIQPCIIQDYIQKIIQEQPWILPEIRRFLTLKSTISSVCYPSD